MNNTPLPRPHRVSFFYTLRRGLGVHCRVFTQRYIAPDFTKEEHETYREKILNIVLIGFISFMLFGLSTITYATIYRPAYKGITPIYFLILTVLPFILLVLSRKGYVKTAAYGLLSIFLVGSYYGMLRWGISLPASLLFLACTIILAGIIISKHASIIVAGITDLVILGAEQYHLRHPPFLAWKLIPTSTADSVDYVFILGVITLISWLAAREIDRFVRKILSYQQELKNEKDSLEIKVQERTREIRELKSKELRDTQHMADLGRLASGMFHDLIGPLSTASIYLESIQPHTLEETKSYVVRATGAASRMKSYLGAVERSIKDGGIQQTVFAVRTEIEHALKLLSFKSKQHNVTLEHTGDETFIQGNPIRFFQIILNLVSNAIDACAVRPDSHGHKVTVHTINTPSKMILQINDTGGGLPDANVFERYATHKDPTQHNGLGLWIVRTSVIEDFKGGITTTSSPQGTCFTITIPHKYIPSSKNSSKHLMGGS